MQIGIKNTLHQLLQLIYINEIATEVKFNHNRYERRTGSEGPGPELFAFDDELISIKKLTPE